jgi:ferredoxin
VVLDLDSESAAAVEEAVRGCPTGALRRVADD